MSMLWSGADDEDDLSWEGLDDGYKEKQSSSINHFILIAENYNFILGILD